MTPVICLMKNGKTINEFAFRFLLQFAPPEKQERILRQRVKQNTDNMLVGAALIRHMIWKRFQILLSQQHIAYGPYGKPYLRDYLNIHFNISHSGTYVACTVADRPVGIDVQVITECRPDVAVRVCSGEELARIEASDNPAVEFTKLWTQKEAHLKMLGRGIIGGMRELPAEDETQIQTFMLSGAALSIAHQQSANLISQK